MGTSAGQYSDPDINYYEQKYQKLILKNFRQKAQALGLEVIPISHPTECVS
jgi:hypothetical protein